MKRHQRGITMLGFICILILVGFFALILMRIVPIYSEHMSVVNAMEGVRDESGVANMPPAKIYELLGKRFNINYVQSVKRENIKLKRNGQGYDLTIAYEVRTPFMYNLDFIASFSDTVQLGGSGGGG